MSTVCAALNAHLNPQVLVLQNRRQYGHGTRIVVAVFAEVAALGDVLHLAARHDSLILTHKFKANVLAARFADGHGFKPLRQSRCESFFSASPPVTATVMRARTKSFS